MFFLRVSFFTCLFAFPLLAGDLDDYLKELTAGARPGFTVAITKGNEVVFQGAYGYADLERSRKIRSSTRFELASVSKQMTAMAILILKERGLLSYEDRVTKYLPELSNVGGKITIHHLLQHTAGLKEYFDLCKDRQITNADVVRWVSGEKLEFSPGAKHEYSNTGYNLLASIVERITREPFKRFLAKNIFQPAGMRLTFLNTLPRPYGRNLAIGYSKALEPQLTEEILRCNTAYGDGSIYSTAGDVARWNLALDRNLLVSASTLKDAFTAGKTSLGVEFLYGFGWRLDPAVDLPAVHHSGSWAGFHNWNVRFANGYRAVVLSNYDESPTKEVVARAKKEFFPAGE